MTHFKIRSAALSAMAVMCMMAPAMAQPLRTTPVQKLLEVRGRFAHYALNDSGAVSGMVLTSGAEYSLTQNGAVDDLVLVRSVQVALPPGASGDALAGFTAGDEVTVRGKPADVGPSVIATVVTDNETGVIRHLAAPEGPKLALQ